MFVAVKAVVNQIPPIELVWLRYLIATACLVIYAGFKHIYWHWNTKQIILCVIIGILGYNISLITQESGTLASNAQMGAVVTTAMPIFMIILARIFLNEKLNVGKLVAIAIAIVGVFVIVGNNMAEGQSIKGIILFLISSLAWAGSSIMFEKASNFYSNLQITIIGMITTLVILTPWTTYHWKILASINYFEPKICFSLLFIGCITTAVAYLMWNAGMRMTSPDTAGMMYLLQPIVGTTLGWLILGEQVSIGFAIGTALIIGSVAVYLKAR